VVEQDARDADRRRRTPARGDGRVVDRAAERAEPAEQPGRAESDRDEDEERDQEWVVHFASFVRGFDERRSSGVGAHR